MSRDEVIEILYDMRGEYDLLSDKEVAIRYYALSWVIKEMERKTGHWINDCVCSVCHWIHEDDKGFALLTNYSFCPNCGAKMSKVEK